MHKRWVELTALLVEDDAIQAQLLATTLESAGFKTVIATTGAVGIENYRASAFDFVLVDLHLPDVSGIDVIQIIAAHTGNTASIIAISGTHDQQKFEAALAAGAHDVYQKQIGPHVLRAKFSRLALEMVEERRGKQQVDDIERRLNDTINSLSSCAAERTKEIEDLATLLRHHTEQPPILNEEQLEAIADRAAEKAARQATADAAQMALELMEKNMQIKIGKFIMTNSLIVVGAVVIGLFSWLAGKGLIKV